MHKERKEKDFVKQPIYPGGLTAMRELIRKELRYPKKAIENKIEGTVYLKYDIDFKGTVTDSKVLSSLGYGCDEEAQRIVKKFKFKVPKTPRKLKVKYHKTIKIHFKLPKEKVVPKKSNNPNTSTLSYTIKPSPQQATTQDQQKKKSTYTYTIKY